MHHLHSLIAFFTGAVVVNVPTEIDSMFTPHMIGDVILFLVKTLGAGLISVGINKYVDWKKKNKNTEN
jgi:xanthine/uracil permease